MAKATRSVHPLHFEDLGGHRFEDLVRQLLHNFRDWHALEATGRSGSDDGIDILGIEFLEEEDGSITKERKWIIQCKNYKRMGPAAVRKIVAEDLKDQPEKPFGYMLAASCDFSAQARKSFHEEVKKYGVQQYLIWGKGELEDQLFSPQNAHLLKAYFDISIHDQPKPPGPPLDLPPLADHFTGRENEIQKLIADLQPGAVVTITGPGGMGKTALAAQALYRMTKEGTQPPNHFPDGVLTYSFYGKPEVALALEYLVKTFGGEALPTPQEAARALFQHKQAVLVMDGAEQADDLEAVLSLRGRCCLLVTSRDRADIHEIYQDLDPLPTGENGGAGKAEKLLQAWGRDCIDDPAAARRICELVGGLPLAVRLAGKYLNEHGELASEYLNWLETTPLEALKQGDRQRDSVPLLLSRSLKQVSQAGCQALGVIGLLGLAPFDPGLVAVGLDLEERKTRHALGELVKFSLLERKGGGYVVAHALVHTFARFQVGAPEGSLERLVKAVGNLAYQANQSGLPEQFKPLRPHIRSLAEAAEKAELEDAGWLWNELGYHQNDVAEFAGAQAAYERALKIDEAVFGPDHPNVAIRVNNLGGVLKELGDHAGAQAAYERALKILEKVLGTEHPNVATLVNNLGLVLKELGDHAGAKAAYERALGILRKYFPDDHPSIQIILRNLSSLDH